MIVVGPLRPHTRWRYVDGRRAPPISPSRRRGGPGMVLPQGVLFGGNLADGGTGRRSGTWGVSWPQGRPTRRADDCRIAHTNRARSEVSGHQPFAIPARTSHFLFLLSTGFPRPALRARENHVRRSWIHTPHSGGSCRATQWRSA